MFEGVGGSVGADLAAIEARLAAATPGPWRVTDTMHVLALPQHGEDLERYVVALVDLIYDADAEFIAHAPADIKALLREIARLTARLVAHDERLAEVSRLGQQLREAEAENERLKRQADNCPTRSVHGL